MKGKSPHKKHNKHLNGKISKKKRKNTPTKNPLKENTTKKAKNQTLQKPQKQTPKKIAQKNKSTSTKTRKTKNIKNQQTNQIIYKPKRIPFDGKKHQNTLTTHKK